MIEATTMADVRKTLDVYIAGERFKQGDLIVLLRDLLWILFIDIEDGKLEEQ
jgi:hypothetical protein